MRDPANNKLFYNNILSGIFFTEGTFWRNQRRFMLRNLRDFGFGRRFQELEIHMDEELRDFVDLVKSGPKYDYEKVSYLLRSLWTEFYKQCIFRIS